MGSKRGRAANSSGKQGENTAEALFIPYMPVLMYKEWTNEIHYPPPVAVRQYVVPHPWKGGDDRRSTPKNDFMLFLTDRTVYVQVKNQTSDGSTDEKLIASFEIARFAMGEARFDEFWLVLLGSYWGKHMSLLAYCSTYKCQEFHLLTSGMGVSAIARLFHGPIELAEHLKGVMCLLS